MSKKTEKPREQLRGQVPLRQGDILRIPVGVSTPQSGGGKEECHGGFWAIVASHDCDIEASSEKEPYIEIIPIEQIAKISSQYAHTRNSRLLDVELRDADLDGIRAARIDATLKRPIEKRHLWDLQLERPYLLNRRGLKEFVNWLSARYKRAALPNEFGSRFKKMEDKFWKLLEEFNDCTSAILLLFDEGQERRDCPEGEPYFISIYVVCPKEEDSDSERLEALIQKIYDLFGVGDPDAASGGASGIEVRQCLAIAEDQLVLSLYNDAIQLTSDWRSYKVEPPGPLLGS
ncbi:MAG TPA: hypothetical protein VN670_05035 [Acidobacteriaceae bacterium]|nr:hypothetical protein [Acidobacteriaceae bacterium]